MHGVKRDRSQLTAELKAQRKEREAKKIEVYKSLEERVFACRNANDVSVEALELTSQLIRINPELYTAWNYRRKILVHLFDGVDDDDGNDTKPARQEDFFASLKIAEAGPSQHERSASDKQNNTRKSSLLGEDLELTIEVLKIHPKVYWIWNHRKWCLQESPSTDAQGTAKWTKEIFMVNKMLEMDSRNFHGWNYRRFILGHLAVPRSEEKTLDRIPPFPLSMTSSSLPQSLKIHQLKLAESELAFTLSKIENNFSNFSAWHHRSLLLEPIWTARGLDEAQKRKERDEEFELVRQAMFVDPEDQSVWTYHSWLVGIDPAVDVLEREVDSIKELLELESESKGCMVALAEYLGRLSGAEQNKRADLQREANSLWERLVELDPDRRNRYLDSIQT